MFKAFGAPQESIEIRGAEWLAFDVTVPPLTDPKISVTFTGTSTGDSVAFAVYNLGTSGAWNGGWIIGKVGQTPRVHASTDNSSSWIPAATEIDLAVGRMPTSIGTFTTSQQLNPGSNRLLVIAGTNFSFKGTVTIDAPPTMTVTSSSYGLAKVMTLADFHGTVIGGSIPIGFGLAKGAQYSVLIRRALFAAVETPTGGHSEENLGGVELTYTSPNSSGKCIDFCQYVMSAGPYSFSVNASQAGLFGDGLVFAIADAN
ncbi:MAG: hypothetical protein ACYDCC_14160 [Actinomycetota bacterium]